jgi:hypothetical protein
MLLLSGVLEASMNSRAKIGENIKTSHLELAYSAHNFAPMREMGESWKIVTETTLEPSGIDHSGRGSEMK